ncbi:MAG: CDC27 family protein, partial [Opitutales bacterium]
MKMPRLFALVLSISAIGQVALGEDAKTDPNLKAGQLALRSKEYKVAVTALDKVIAAKKERMDEATYLKALAQYYGKQYDACIATCDKLAADHKDSSWQHKGRFLMARTLIAQKDHKAAESILAAEAGRIFSPDRKQSIA